MFKLTEHYKTHYNLIYIYFFYKCNKEEVGLHHQKTKKKKKEKEKEKEKEKKKEKKNKEKKKEEEGEEENNFIRILVKDIIILNIIQNVPF